MNAGMQLIALAGGIGSGKSVVSKILLAMGYPVYDCDNMAKQIMDADAEIHSRLCSEIHPQSVVEGVIDRALISKIVFEDKAALARLNAIVHTAVKADLNHWVSEKQFTGAKKVFVETAILIQSGLVDLVDDIWEVTAPIEVKVERVKKRNGLSEKQILARIESQKTESLEGIAHKTICNSPSDAVLPQIVKLLG